MPKYTKAMLKARDKREERKQIDGQVRRLRHRYGLNRPLPKHLKVMAEAGIRSVLDEEIRDAAEEKVQELLEAEVDDHLGRERYERKPQIEHQGYRNGHAPERTLTTPCGSVKVSRPKLRDLKVPFESRVLARGQGQTAAVDDFLPDLYLAGLSLGDFELFLREFLGDDACLSTGYIARLKASWEAQYRIWAKRPLSPACAYVWADGIYLRLGPGRDRLAVLVILGVTEDGKKELLAVEPGYRESDANWKSVFLSLRERGLNEIRLVIGDGCLGLWNAVDEYFWAAAQQLCWRHKKENILAKLPERLLDEANADLDAIRYAITKARAQEQAMAFAQKYSAHERAVATLLAALDRLLTFFDFPKGHWIHITTTNPIESIFDPVRTRLNKTKRLHSLFSGLALVQQLLLVRQPRLVRIRRYRLVASVIAGERYVDGIAVDRRTKASRKFRAA